MEHTNFQKSYSNKMELPFKDIADLNKKAFTNFSHLNPIGFTHMKSPGEFLEKSVHMFVENGHETLDYLSHLFYIWEKNMLHLSDETWKNTEKMVGKTQKMTKNLINKSSQKKSSQVKMGRGKSTSASSSRASSSVAKKQNSPSRLESSTNHINGPHS